MSHGASEGLSESISGGTPFCPLESGTIENWDTESLGGAEGAAEALAFFMFVAFPLIDAEQQGKVPKRNI